MRQVLEPKLRVRMLTIGKVNPSQREIHDCRIFFLHKIILCEAFVVQNDIAR